MDAATRGASALQNKDYPAAISAYTAALTSSPSSPTYHIQRSLAYQRLKNYPSALLDANRAVLLARARGRRELIQQAQLRRAVPLFFLERYGDSRICLEWAGGAPAPPVRGMEGMMKKESENAKMVGIWVGQIEGRVKKLGLQEGDEALMVRVREWPDVQIPGVSGKTLGRMAEAEAREVELGANADGEGPASAAQSQSSSRTSVETRSTGSTAPAPPPAPKPAPAVPAASPAASTQTQATQTQTPATKIRQDWYQTSDAVIFTLFAKGVPKNSSTVIDIQATSLSISFPLASGSSYEVNLDPLYAPIDSSGSSYRVLSTKIEVVLRKMTPGLKWHSLESQVPASVASVASSGGSGGVGGDELAGPSASASASAFAAAEAKGPVYPTSSRRGPKDWDAIASSKSSSKKPAPNTAAKGKGKDKAPVRTTPPGDVSDDTMGSSPDESNAEAQGEDDFDSEDEEDKSDPNFFFKKLYAGASDEVKRAMMKSYQESGGTALSTNWSEVSKGPVKVEPPEGMEAKEW